MPEAPADAVAAVLSIVGGLACALLLGGMVTFAGIFARTAFAQLPQATATSFMRAAFSSYYVVMAVFAAVAAASLAWFRPLDALVLGFVAIGFLVSRQWLMPDRKRVVWGRSVSVRVYLGGLRSN